MRTPDFYPCENKGAVSCAVTAQLISAFVVVFFFAALIVQFLFFLNVKFQASNLMPDLVGNPEDRFSRVTAHMLY